MSDEKKSNWKRYRWHAREKDAEVKDAMQGWTPLGRYESDNIEQEWVTHQETTRSRG